MRLPDCSANSFARVYNLSQPDVLSQLRQFTDFSKININISYDDSLGCFRLIDGPKACRPHNTPEIVLVQCARVLAMSLFHI